MPAIELIPNIPVKVLALEILDDRQYTVAAKDVGLRISAVDRH